MGTFAALEGETAGVAGWTRAVATLFPAASVDIARPHDFAGRLAWRALGGVTVCELGSCAQTVERTRRHVGADPAPGWEINLQLEGSGELLQAGRRGTTVPGECVIYDSQRPYEMRFAGAFRQLTVRIPRAAAPALAVPEEVLCAALPAGEGALSVFVAMAKAIHLLPDCGAQTESALRGRFVETFALAVGAGSGAGARSAAPMRRTTAERIKADLEARLGERLTPPRVAARHGISVRQLHALFARDGTSFGRWVLERRLARCRDDLQAESKRGEAISAIAARWGFCDPAHFSRAYRARYGNAPRHSRRDGGATG